MAGYPSTSVLNDDLVGQLQSQLTASDARVAQLQQEKTQMELDFDYKRSKIKELYYAKENAIREQTVKLQEATRHANEMESTIARLQEEIDNVKMIAAVSENTKEEAVQDINKHHQEEIESLRRVLQDSMEEERRDLVLQFEQERRHWEQEIEKLKVKQNEMPEVTHVKPDGYKSHEDREMEISMQKAQTEAETLRAVVLPLENEIAALKQKLKRTEEVLSNAVNKPELAQDKKLKDSNLSEANGYYEKETHVEIISQAQLDELSCSLRLEKLSRFDLEQHVEVLTQQKEILQKENDTLKVEMHEVCRMLEHEQIDHNSLKDTWNAANEEFLNSQKLLTSDLKIVESVLTQDQWKEVKALQLSAENELLEKDVPVVVVDQSSNSKPISLQNSNDNSSSNQQAITSRMDEDDDGDGDSFTSFQEHSILIEIPTSMTVDSVSTLPTECQDTISVNSVASMPSTTSAIPDDVHRNGRVLSAPQLNHIDADEQSHPLNNNRRLVISQREPNAWDEVAPSTIKSSEPTHGSPLHSLVSAKPTEALQKECAALRERVSELEMLLEEEKSLRITVEESVMKASEAAKKQVTDITDKLTKLETRLTEDKSWRRSKETEDDKRLSQLLKDRDKIYEDFVNIKREQELFRNTYKQHKIKLNKDEILPGTIEGLKLLIHNYREALLYAEVQKNHTESTLQNRLNFLQDRLQAEQVAKEQIENTLMAELDEARKELASSHDVKRKLEKATESKKELQSHLQREQNTLGQIRSKSQDIIRGLKEKLKFETTAKAELENKVAVAKNQLRSLQDALETSEHVQQDFVRLSQSLQMQLEEIRLKEEKELSLRSDNSANSSESNGSLPSLTSSNPTPG